MRITKKIGTIAAIPALAVPLAAGPAMASTTPTVGIADNTNYFIGDNPAYPYNYSMTGSQPIAPGSSGTWTVLFANCGNVNETFSATQYGAGGGAANPPVYTWGLQGVPDSWVAYTIVGVGSYPTMQPYSPGTAWQPGQTIEVNVTVTVPANAQPGLYGGTFMGTASAVQQGSGNITSAVGAGDREYIRVS